MYVDATFGDADGLIFSEELSEFCALASGDTVVKASVLVSTAAGEHAPAAADAPTPGEPPELINQGGGHWHQRLRRSISQSGGDGTTMGPDVSLSPKAPEATEKTFVSENLTNPYLEVF